MPQLEILEFPDSRLRTIAAPVPEVNDAIRSTIVAMFETMYSAHGIGLAATQVDIHHQIIVMDVSEDKTEPLVFINPNISVIDKEVHSYDEGCLSVPGFHEAVKRPKRVKVEALDKDGEPFVMELEGLHAVCIQHEVDHLNGKLFVDYISSIKRNRIRKKLEKQHRT